MRIECERALLAALIALYDSPLSNKELKNSKTFAMFGVMGFTSLS